MTRRLAVWMRLLLLLLSSGWLFQAGCARILIRETEVLFAPLANPYLIPQSVVVDLLGIGVLQFLNQY